MFGMRILFILAITVFVFFFFHGNVADIQKKDSIPEKRLPVQMTPKELIQKLDARQQNMASWKDLRASIQESLRYVAKRPVGDLAVGDVTFGDLYYSLLLLEKLLPEIDKRPEVLLEHFEWVALHSADKAILFTGYYHPVFQASRGPQPGSVPLYRTPKDTKQKALSRRAIAEGALAGQNLEIAWINDPFEAFLLGVQGSGCLEFEDGTRQCLRYAGQNGRKYKSSRRILEERGLLVAPDIFEQRRFFAEHPEHLPLLLENPSYVFFSETDEPLAIGAMERPLRDWQAVAVDKRVIPLGSIVAIETTIPDKDKGYVPLCALTLAQDTGGAIKERRIDIYCGSSKKAEFVAAKLDAQGSAWMLLAKDRPTKLSLKKQ
ncbi:MAG: MltA domain-containing protein [Desulfovibrionaceae bacterium]|nr:MltA domain-containing protein [Desulfovibrionaceae bacterium]